MTYQEMNIGDKYSFAPGAEIFISGKIGNWTDAHVNDKDGFYLISLGSTYQGYHIMVCSLPARDGKVLGQDISGLTKKVIAAVKARTDVRIAGRLTGRFDEISGERRVLLADRIEFI